MLSTLPATRSLSGSTRGFATIDPERQGVLCTARIAPRAPLAFSRPVGPSGRWGAGLAVVRPDRETGSRRPG